jgi:alpha-L-fucosidase
MFQGVVLNLLLIAFVFASGSKSKSTMRQSPIPTQALLQYQDREIGAMFSFDMVTELLDNRNGQHFCINVGGDRGFPVPPASTWNPTKLNLDNWMDAAEAMGAKYSVLIAMHCSGFAQWQTDISSYNGTEGFNYTYSTKYSVNQVDLVHEYMTSSSKYGIVPGLYVSLNENYYLNVGSGKVQPTSTLAPGQVNVSQDVYNAITVAQQTELWKRYAGRFGELWFDGSDDIPGVNDALAMYQPQAVYFGGSMPYNNIRWVGTESGTPSYPVWSNADPGSYGTGNPNGTVFMPAESDTTTNPNDVWFWNADYQYRTLQDLQAVYHATVGSNSNMLLNIAPDADGLVPDVAMQLYSSFGSWVKKCYGSPQASISYPPDGSNIILQFTPGLLQTIDRVVIMENQFLGEQVEAYSVTVQTSDGTWQNAGSGSAIGHKRIHIFPTPIANPTAVQVTVTQTIGSLDASQIKWVSFSAIDGVASQC